MTTQTKCTEKVFRLLYLNEKRGYLYRPVSSSECFCPRSFEVLFFGYFSAAQQYRYEPNTFTQKIVLGEEKENVLIMLL